MSNENNEHSDADRDSNADIDHGDVPSEPRDSDPRDAPPANHHSRRNFLSGVVPLGLGLGVLQHGAVEEDAATRRSEPPSIDPEKAIVTERDLPSAFVPGEPDIEEQRPPIARELADANPIFEQARTADSIFWAEGTRDDPLHVVASFAFDCQQRPDPDDIVPTVDRLNQTFVNEYDEETQSWWSFTTDDRPVPGGHDWEVEIQVSPPSPFALGSQVKPYLNENDDLIFRDVTRIQQVGSVLLGFLSFGPRRSDWAPSAVLPRITRHLRGRVIAQGVRP